MAFEIIFFCILIIILISCITLLVENDLRPFALIFSLFLMITTGILIIGVMEVSIKRDAIKNNAAYWEVKIDPISGNSTKTFKWGPKPTNKPNEPNEQQANEPNEKSK